jgi:hypothetical protein
MFGLTSGELFIVLFILGAVVSAPLWPKLGAAVYMKLFSRNREGGGGRPEV